MVMKKALGQQGEEAAIKFLKKRGYRILERNFRCPLGEIDVVSRHNDTLVFVEVKTRSSHAYGLPEEAIDYRKQRKLKQLAYYYMKYKGLGFEVKCRFDVVSVLKDSSINGFEIRIIQNAF